MLDIFNAVFLIDIYFSRTTLEYQEWLKKGVCQIAVDRSKATGVKTWAFPDHLGHSVPIYD